MKGKKEQGFRHRVKNSRWNEQAMYRSEMECAVIAGVLARILILLRTRGDFGGF